MYAVVPQVRMATSLPGGLLERMVSLTEALLVALGQPQTSTASANHGDSYKDHSAISSHQTTNCKSWVNTKTTVFTSHVPASICSGQIPKQRETHRRTNSGNAAAISTTTTVCSPGTNGEQKVYLPTFGPQQVNGARYSDSSRVLL